jgi:hypothetical protein
MTVPAVPIRITLYPKPLLVGSAKIVDVSSTTSIECQSLANAVAASEVETIVL